MLMEAILCILLWTEKNAVNKIVIIIVTPWYQKGKKNTHLIYEIAL